MRYWIEEFLPVLLFLLLIMLPYLLQKFFIKEETPEKKVSPGEESIGEEKRPTIQFHLDTGKEIRPFSLKSGKGDIPIEAKETFIQESRGFYLEKEKNLWEKSPMKQLNNLSDLKRAVLWKEILDPPKGLD